MVRICSLNVHGLRDVLKRRSLFNFYRKRCDILCFQETHSQESDEKIWSAEWGGRIIWTHGTTDSRGVMILFKKGMGAQFSNVQHNLNGRIISCDIDDNGKSFSLINVYAPNTDCPQFFKEVEMTKQVHHENCVIIGDFNITLEMIDRLNSYETKSKAVSFIKEMMEESMLVDVWRQQNLEVLRYSWYRTKPKLVASRLDYALIAQGLADQCEQSFYFTGLSTDHSAFYISLNLADQERGRSYWKFNNSFLKDSIFLESMNKMIDTFWKIHGQEDIIGSWELFKFQISHFAQEYGREKASDRELLISVI